MALGPNPNPQPTPTKSPSEAALALSLVRAVQTCSTGLLAVLLRCPGPMQMLGSPGATPGIWDFSVASVVALQLQTSPAFCFSSVTRPLGRCQGAQARPGGLSFGACPGHHSLQVFMPAVDHPWELVHCFQLREFSFCYFLHDCFCSICPVSSF